MTHDRQTNADRSEAAPQPPRRRASGEQPAPFWVFNASGEPIDREELLARYRRQRMLPDDPFENGARPVPPPGYRDEIMNRRNGERFMARPAPAAEAAPKRKLGFTLGETFAIAAAMSLVAGGAACLGSALLPGFNGSAPPSALAPAPIAEAAPPKQAQPLRVAQAATAPAKAVERKPIATATLQVADVTGKTNSFIPLALHAEPASLGEEMTLKISGVPQDAYLTSGRRGENAVWSLSLAESKGVKLVVPQARQPQLDLAVAVIEPRTGELAAPVKTMTVALNDVVVTPASAPPPGFVAAQTAPAKSALPGAANTMGPVAIPLPQSISIALAVPETAETQQLINEADQQFGSGDVAAARRNYERAWGNDGSAAAAFGIARSYDPLVLAALSASNATPDKAQAIQWYQRAATRGNGDATEAIVRLRLKP